MKNNKKKGFTLAELLIVVAIIAVLVLIAIPVFTTSLKKSEIATDKANCRSYYGELQSKGLADDDWSVTADKATTITFGDGTKYDLKRGTYSVTGTKDKGYELVYNCNDADGKQTWGTK